MFQYELTYNVYFRSGEKHPIKIGNTDFYIDNPRFQIRVDEEELPFKHNEIMKNGGVKFLSLTTIVGGVVEVSFKGTPDSVYLMENGSLRSNEDGTFSVQILNKDFTNTMNYILRNYDGLEILELIRY